MPKIVVTAAVKDVEAWLTFKADMATALSAVASDGSSYVAMDGSNQVASTWDVPDMESEATRLGARGLKGASPCVFTQAVPFIECCAPRVERVEPVGGAVGGGGTGTDQGGDGCDGDERDDEPVSLHVYLLGCPLAPVAAGRCAGCNPAPRNPSGPVRNG